MVSEVLAGEVFDQDGQRVYVPEAHDGFVMVDRRGMPTWSNPQWIEGFDVLSVDVPTSPRTVINMQTLRRVIE